MNYRKAILKVIEHEGGDKITNHKNDLGGLTKFGISQRAYPLLNIASITLEDAVSIYKRDYWDKVLGDQIKSYAVAFSIFDQAVNRGVGTAIKMAQKAAGVKADGSIGPVTLNAINAKPEGEFLNNFINIAKSSYESIVNSNPSQNVFLKGWMNRLDSLNDYAQKNMGMVQASMAGILILLSVALLLISGSKKT